MKCGQDWSQQENTDLNVPNRAIKANTSTTAHGSNVCTINFWWWFSDKDIVRDPHSKHMDIGIRWCYIDTCKHSIESKGFKHLCIEVVGYTLADPWYLSQPTKQRWTSYVPTIRDCIRLTARLSQAGYNGWTDIQTRKPRICRPLPTQTTHMNKRTKSRKEKEPVHIEAFKRMNFLFQAAHTMPPEAAALSRFYLGTMKAISQRLVIRLYDLSTTAILPSSPAAALIIKILRRDPSVKSTMCACCGTMLIPGETATYRLHCS